MSKIKRLGRNRKQLLDRLRDFPHSMNTSLIDDILTNLDDEQVGILQRFID